MFKKFPNSHQIWNWLVTSSSNPAAVSLTVKGGMVTTLAIFVKLLPLFHVPVSPDLANVPDTVYTVTYAGLSFVGTVVAAFGLFRKIWNTLAKPQSPDQI